jgi:hypothetical protein
MRAPRLHPAGSSQATRGWFETLRLYRDRAWAGASGEDGEVRKDDRRPTALRARPPRGAPRPRARVLRDPVVGRVVVAMRDSGDELDPEPTGSGPGGAVWTGMATGSATRGAMHRGQAGLACWREDRWPVLRPGCAAEGMAVPLAVKELRPLRGAFGVLDREPLARHRQKGPAGKEPASGDAAQPSNLARFGSSFGSSSHASRPVPGELLPTPSGERALPGTRRYPAGAVS